jgi:hypothetical protein
MGFGDKLKGLTQQAKETVAENRGKIQEAVDAASVVANERTRGKYANKIMKVNEKTGSALDKFSSGAEADDAASEQAADSGEAAFSEPVASSPAAAEPEPTAPPTADPSYEGPTFDD